MNLKRKRMKKMMMGLATFALVFNSFAPVFAETIDDSVPVDPVRETNFFPKITTPRIDVNPTDPFTYVNDDTGIYPTHHTQSYTNNNNSDNIQNFDFSKENSEVTPTENVLGTGSMDFENGYHSYNDAYVKKIVIPTDDPNNFKIQLDVIGKALKETQPVDVALVLDKSSSMNKQMTSGWNSPTRWNVLQDAVSDFSNQLLNPSNNGMIHLGLANFGSDGGTDWLGNLYTDDLFANIATFSNGTGFTDNANEYMSKSLIKNEPGVNSGTPTFLGLDAGYQMLTDAKYGARSDAQKVIIVLTDGVPTYSPNLNSYNDGLNSSSVEMKPDSRGFDAYQMTSDSDWNGNGSEGQNHLNQIIDQNHNYILNRSSQFADIIKYSIGFATGSNALEILRALGPDGYYSAANEEDLIDALNQLKNRLSNSIQNGVVTDPMSEFVTYKVSPELSALKVENGALTEIKQGAANFPAYASEVQVVPENNQVTLNSLNFGGTETEKDGIRLTYNVELKEEYRDGKFYPAKVGHPVDYSKVISNGNPPVMGTIDIPAINVNNLPFYHGTSYGTLDKGVGHFESSSVPIGGKNTRAVLSGHSGLENQVLFTDIKNLKEGDIFFINILGKKLAYEIDSFQEVLPSEVDKVKIVPGEDRVTLLTCTPPGINTYRLLVNGKRIPYKEAMSKKTSKRNIWTYQTVVMGSLGLCFLLFVILFLLYRIFLKQSRKKDPEISARAMKRIRRLIMVTRGMFVVMLVIMISILGFAIYGYFRMQIQSALPNINVGKQHELSAYNPDKILKADYDESKIASVNVTNFAESRKNLQHTVNDNGIGKLYIPKEEVNLPILAGISQTNLMTGASTYRQGQKLGKGNYVLLAHNIYNVNTNQNVDVLFNRISNLVKGDKVYATDFQNVYEYQVTKNEVIKDTQVDVVNSEVKGTPILTLIRCEGNVGTVYRRLVQGHLTKTSPLNANSSKTMNLSMTGNVSGDNLIKTSPISPFEQLSMDLAAHIISDPMQVMIPFFLLLVLPILFLNFI